MERHVTGSCVTIRDGYITVSCANSPVSKFDLQEKDRALRNDEGRATERHDMLRMNVVLAITK